MEDNDQQDELEKMILISANPELASSKESVVDPENELAIESNEMNVDAFHSGLVADGYIS